MENSKYKIQTVASRQKAVSGKQPRRRRILHASGPARRAFTLVELMIVVSILGILAAIVLPEFQGHIQQAKEAAAKDNLRILRQAIERYAADNGVSPGYPDNDSSKTPSVTVLNTQLFQSGKYLSDLPQNPFNAKVSIFVVPNGLTVSEIMIENTDAGWIYQPATKTVKLVYTGIDSKGVSYFDY